MTNLEAMQDEDLRQMIYDLGLLEKMVRYVDADNYQQLYDEISELNVNIKTRWEYLLGV